MGSTPNLLNQTHMAGKEDFVFEQILCISTSQKHLCRQFKGRKINLHLTFYKGVLICNSLFNEKAIYCWQTICFQISNIPFNLTEFSGVSQNLRNRFFFYWFIIKCMVYFKFKKKEENNM